MITHDRKKRYENAKKDLLSDESIAKENRELWREFFIRQEHKLKRINGLSALDDGTYKTLYYYIVRFRNINTWFKNKPWKDLTKGDIQRVYDDLEDGHITSKKGEPFKAKEDYYSKIFKSEPFELAGKADLAREVIRYAHKDKNEVRFILEDDFRRLIRGASKTHHRLLLWLAFDIGENINSLLQLRKKDFSRQADPETGEPEYRINLRQEILKRSRKSRSEITLYPETTELLDEYLPTIEDNDYLFQFDYHNAKMILNRLARSSKVTTIPDNHPVTWKDLRSGMACDLLSKDWSTDQVNARLGHKPSSDEIDKYTSFLALDRNKPKKKIEIFKVKALEAKLDQMEKREKRHNEEMRAIKEQQEILMRAMRTGDYAKMVALAKKKKREAVSSS